MSCGVRAKERRGGKRATDFILIDGVYVYAQFGQCPRVFVVDSHAFVVAVRARLTWHNKDNDEAIKRQMGTYHVRNMHKKGRCQRT